MESNGKTEHESVKAEVNDAKNIKEELLVNLDSKIVNEKLPKNLDSKTANEVNDDAKNIKEELLVNLDSKIVNEKLPKNLDSKTANEVNDDAKNIDENLLVNLDSKIVNEKLPTNLNSRTANEELPENFQSKIVKQIEFYFSDSNLPYDKFLQNEIQADEGWVKISVLLTFKRLASLSRNSEVIAAAVKNATNSIIEVDETNEKIRRKLDQALPVADQDFLNEVIDRSIYCKGFPKTTTMDELLEFAATFGDNCITKVIPRKLKTKEFKGTLYFTFNTKEQASEFLKLESVKYNDIELERMWEKEFLEQKKKEYEDKQVKKDQKIKAKTEKYFKKGFLLKAENLDDNDNVDSIKAICSDFEWKVAFVKLVDDQKYAWIRLKPVKAAKDLLEEIGEKTKDLKITFSTPDEEIEQTVLNEMAKEMEGVLNMNDKMKKEKNKNKGGKRFNYKRRNEDGNEGNSSNKRHKQNDS